MGRKEKPLHATGSPIVELALRLRELRVQAGSPTYRQMARDSGKSTAALSLAAGGHTVPSLDVLRAYVRACGGDTDYWTARWSLAVALHKGSIRMASPTTATNTLEFAGELRLLMHRAGHFSQRAMAAAARRDHDLLLPRSTLSTILKGERLPSVTLLMSFLLVCRLNTDQLRRPWFEARARLASTPATTDIPRPRAPAVSPGRRERLIRELKVLGQGRGTERPDLRGFLGPEVRAVFDVADDDTSAAARRKLTVLINDASYRLADHVRLSVATGLAVHSPSGSNESLASRLRWMKRHLNKSERTVRRYFDVGVRQLAEELLAIEAHRQKADHREIHDTRGALIGP